MAERIRLLNTTDRVLRLRYGGNAIVFQPHGVPGSVVPLPKAAADYVMGHLGNQVEVVAEATAVSYVEHRKIDRYYIANFSGDPDSPEYYESKFLKADGTEGVRRVKNEIHTPQVFKARLGRESKIVDAGAHQYVDQHSGKLTRNKKAMQVTYPGKLLTIPPYTVVEVTQGQFQTLLSMEADKPLDYPRFLRPSRPPSDFEPDYNDPWWTLDRIRMWLMETPETNEREAGQVVAGDSEKELREKWAAEGLEPDAIELQLEETRFKLYARSKIRAMDLDYAQLPSKSEFEASWARRAKAEKTK